MKKKSSKPAALKPSTTAQDRSHAKPTPPVPPTIKDGHLEQINDVLAAQVGKAIGETMGKWAKSPKTGKGTSDAPSEIDALASATTPTTASGGVLKAKGLSMEVDQPKVAKGRKVAILAGPGVSESDISAMKKKLDAEKVLSEIVGPFLGDISADSGTVQSTKTYANTSSVHFDAVYVPGGEPSIDALKLIPDALPFIDEAYKHGKAIAATGAGVDLIKATKTGHIVGGRRGSPRRAARAHGERSID